MWTSPVLTSMVHGVGGGSRRLMREHQDKASVGFERDGELVVGPTRVVRLRRRPGHESRRERRRLHPANRDMEITGQNNRPDRLLMV